MIIYKAFIQFLYLVHVLASSICGNSQQENLFCLMSPNLDMGNYGNNIITNPKTNNGEILSIHGYKCGLCTPPL